MWIKGKLLQKTLGPHAIFNPKTLQVVGNPPNFSYTRGKLLSKKEAIVNVSLADVEVIRAILSLRKKDAITRLELDLLSGNITYVRLRSSRVSPTVFSSAYDKKYLSWGLLNFREAEYLVSFNKWTVFIPEKFAIIPGSDTVVNVLDINLLKNLDFEEFYEVNRYIDKLLLSFAIRFYPAIIVSNTIQPDRLVFDITGSPEMTPAILQLFNLLQKGKDNWKAKLQFVYSDTELIYVLLINGANVVLSLSEMIDEKLIIDLLKNYPHKIELDISQEDLGAYGRRFLVELIKSVPYLRSKISKYLL